MKTGRILATRWGILQDGQDEFYLKKSDYSGSGRPGLSVQRGGM
jgi:hypothetical protein